MALAEDLDVFLADMGVSVTYDGAEPDILGLLDVAGTLVLGHDGRSDISATDRNVLMRTDRLGTLGEDSTITVDSVPYVVRDTQPIEDGAFSIVWLR